MDRTDQRHGEYSRLERLNDLDDYKVADGDPDIRGWDVRTADGAEIGEVEGLIADPATMNVRYVEIEADKDHIGADTDDYVIIPIETARLDNSDDVVYLGSLPPTGLRGAPRFGRETLTPDHDRQLTEYYMLQSERRPEGRDDSFGERRQDRGTEAHVTRSEERLAVGTQEVAAGEVEVDKRVETEHVTREVPTTHEEVVVERRAATGATEARIEDDEVHIPLTEERVVAEKETVPVEEVVVKKREVTETEMVEADLKKERVDIDRTDERR